MTESRTGDDDPTRSGYVKGTIASGANATGAAVRGLAGAAEAGLGEFVGVLKTESVTRISLRNGCILAYIRGWAKFFEALPGIAEEVLEHLDTAPEFAQRNKSDAV